MTKGPVAASLRGRHDQFGPVCADCYGPVYLDRIQTGPRIGVRETWRHVEQNPACSAPPRGLGVRYSALVKP